MGVKEAPAVNTPDRHPRPLGRAREKRRERLAQEESQRNRDLLQSVRVEDSASGCELEPDGACLVCEKVVAECVWDDWDEDIPIHCLSVHWVFALIVYISVLRWTTRNIVQQGAATNLYVVNGFNLDHSSTN